MWVALEFVGWQQAVLQTLQVCRGVGGGLRQGLVRAAHDVLVLPPASTQRNPASPPVAKTAVGRAPTQPPPRVRPQAKHDAATNTFAADTAAAVLEAVQPFAVSASQDGGGGGATGGLTEKQLRQKAMPFAKLKMEEALSGGLQVCLAARGAACVGLSACVAGVNARGGGCWYHRADSASTDASSLHCASHLTHTHTRARALASRPSTHAGAGHEAAL